MAKVIEAIRQADARHGAEQDARRAARRRAARVPAGERRRLLRQLLRLLPARGVRAVDRHVHREGLLHQRGGREAAARGDRVAAVAQGRRRGRVRLGHLRHRLAARTTRARPSSCSVGAERDRDELIRRLVDIQYDRNDYELARGTFRVRGDVLDIFPPYAEHPVRVELLRRRDREHRRGRPGHGRGAHELRYPARLARVALRHHPGTPADRARHDPRRAARAAAAAQGRGQAARGAAARDAHELRPRDARGDGLLQRHRELLAPPRRARAGRARRTASSTTSAATSSAWSTRATSPSRRSAACTRATATASSRSSSTASGCRARSTTGRCASTSSRRACRSSSTSRPRRATTSCTHSTQDRRADHPADRPRRPADRGAPDEGPDRRPRRTRCASTPRRDERVLVTTLTKKMAEDLTDYLSEQGLRVRYLHADVGDARARRAAARAARRHVRLPRRHQPAARGARPARRCRSSRSSTPTRKDSCATSARLIQTIGRAARNVSGKVIMYADKVTDSMQARPSTRRTAAAPSRWRTTPSTASSRRRS